MAKLFAVGWQAAQRTQVVGQLKDFRKARLHNGFENYLSKLQFSGVFEEQNLTLIQKFERARTALENVETNGNNTDVPFYRKLTEELETEYSRYKKVSSQLILELPRLTNFEKIRLYIIEEEFEGITYRFYIKALRTPKLKTRFIASFSGENLNIVDTAQNGKALPQMVCYAEKIENDTVMQYIFSVQDYEDIFGMNETKVKAAKANYAKFLPKDGNEPEFRVSGEYTIEISPESEKNKIYKKISENRKLANLLSKYSNEATDYSWDDVKEANSISEEFLQIPFTFDEASKKIFLTADSLEAWVSVISNTKKLAIASKNFEDSIANSRRNSGTQG
ncbi:hypothetical protein LMK05_08980 [Lactococcus petauri]|nr:hypothetical protein LMK05_08980 [Lactococcus petauri]